MADERIRCAMSQIRNDQPMDLDHYRSNALEPRPEVDEVPRELRNARPAPRASGWKTAGRIALGILTCGLSELIRLAYRGIKACFSSSRPSQAAEARVHAGASGVPAADPEADRHNSDLASALSGNAPWPQEHREAIDSLTDDLRGKYGERYIPQGMTLSEVIASVPPDIDPYVKRDIHMAIRESHHAVSPAELQGAIRQKLVPALNLMVLKAEAEAQAAQIGGLGGLDMTRIMMNQLKAPGVRRQLESAGSEADVLRLAADMGLRQKISDFREAMEDTLDGLRTVYGPGRLPDDLGAALALKNDLGHSIKGMVEGRFHGADRPVSAQELRQSLSEYLAEPLRHLTVESALTEKARSMGIPLSRRATVLMANSLIAKQEYRTALESAADPRALENVIESMDLEALLQAQKAHVERLYAAHSPDVPPELRPMLRAFIEGFSFAPSAAAASEARVADMAERMKAWKNLDGTEPARQPLNDVFRQNYAEDLARLEGSGERTGYTNNIYDTLLADAQRSDYVIDGTAIGRRNARAELPEALRNAAPDPKDQQFLSKLMNQRMWSNLVVAATTGLLPDGTLLNDLPGGNSLPATPPGSMPLLQDFAGQPSVFTLSVSPDKKTAEVTATLFQQMNFADGLLTDGKMPLVGGVKFTMHFRLNLNAHEGGQSVAGFRMGQEFIPIDRLNA